jgi:hypothetical protein
MGHAAPRITRRHDHSRGNLDRLPGPARAISEIQHWTNWRRHHQGQAAKATTSADSPLNSTHNELTPPC